MSSATAPAKTTKVTAKKAAAEVVTSASVAAPAATAPAAAPKATKKAAVEKVVAAPAAAPAATAAPVPATATATATATTDVAAVSEDDVGAQLTAQINTLHEQLAAQKAAFAATAAGLKVIEKLAARLIKKAGRKGKGKSKAVDGAPAKPCVFTEPTTVSAELGAFLGLAKGALISRSNVTSGIVNYAKSHSLMNKQAINTDAALRKLLGVTETDNLTILNLQKYLSKHYVKAAPVAA
jgi:chromatin remodeling complex protein RSC6